jgi:hypothetical protein
MEPHPPGPAGGYYKSWVALEVQQISGDVIAAFRRSFYVF